MSAIRPRPEQVAALTRGQQLPLPPLQETILRTVAETLVRAWNELTSAHGTTLRAGDEAEVTSLLASRLNALLDEDDCWEDIVCGISREGSQISYDGSHIGKSPDISIHLIGRRFDFPLIIECKLIDHPRRKTIALYCQQGIKRFVDGEYAWMCTEAFMLAYVRDGSNIAGTLPPHLATATDCVTAELPRSLSGSIDLARSSHGRPFAYLGGAGLPGPIVLWHLWLTTPSKRIAGKPAP